MKVYTSNPDNKPFVNEFLLGLKRHGVRSTQQFSKADFVLLWGLSDSYLIDQCHREGKPYLVTELGYLKATPASDSCYFQAGWNKLCWIPDVEAVDDRWKALGLTAKEDKKPEGDRWLIAAQVPDDFRHGLDAEQLGFRYVAYAEAIIRANPEAHITLRMHPYCPTLPKSAQYRSEDSTLKLSRSFDQLQRYVPLSTSLACSDKVVSVNSNFFYYAYLEGIPVYCDRAAHYASEASGHINDIQSGKCKLSSVPQKVKFLSRVSYAQWNKQEANSGAAWDFLKNFLP